MDGATGVGLQKSLRAIREEENECAIGGLRNAVRSVAKLPGWSLVGVKVASIVEELVGQNEGELEQVLDSLGDKTKSYCVLETLVRSFVNDWELCWASTTSSCSLVLGGLFPGVVRGLTEAAQDPDVHIHEWLRGQVPLGISTKIPPGGVFPAVSPQSVGREKDRIRQVHAKKSVG